eukprot:PhF_6_TR2235/c3_g9_i1/m.3774
MNEPFAQVRLVTTESSVRELQAHISGALSIINSLLPANPQDIKKEVICSLTTDASLVLGGLKQLQLSQGGLEDSTPTTEEEGVPMSPSWNNVLKSLKDHVLSGILHDRVLHTFERFVHPLPAPRIKDIHDLIEAAQFIQGHSMSSGNVEKFGGDDLRSFQLDNLAPREIPNVELSHPENIFDAVRSIGLKRLHEYRMCVVCDCIASAKDSYHWFTKPKCCGVEGYQHIVITPVEEDLLRKMDRFWVRFELTQRNASLVGRPQYLGEAIGMNKDDVLAIYLYTLQTEIYADMNSALRDGKQPEELRRYSGYMYFLLRALKKLPKHNLRQSQLYRGIDVDLREQYRGAEFIRWHAFSSTTASASMVKKFINSSSTFINTSIAKPTGTIFLVRSHFGSHIKDFSAFPVENEVLLPPNTLLRISGAISESTKELIGSQLGGIDLTDVFMVELQDATRADVVKYERELLDGVRNAQWLLSSDDCTENTIEIVVKLLTKIDRKLLENELKLETINKRFLHVPRVVELLPETVIPHVLEVSNILAGPRMDEMVKCISQRLQRCNTSSITPGTSLCPRFLQYRDIIASLPVELLRTLDDTDVGSPHILLYLCRILDSPSTSDGSVKIARSTIYRYLDDGGRESSQFLGNQVVKNTERFKKLTPTCRCLVVGALWSPKHYLEDQWICEDKTRMLTTILDMIPNEGIDVRPSLHLVASCHNEPNLQTQLLSRMNKPYVFDRLFHDIIFNVNLEIPLCSISDTLRTILKVNGNVLPLVGPDIDATYGDKIKTRVGWTASLSSQLCVSTWKVDGNVDVSLFTASALAVLFEIVNIPNEIYWSGGLMNDDIYS